MASTGGKSGVGCAGEGSATGWSKRKLVAISGPASRMRFRNSASNDATRQRSATPKTLASFATRRAIVPACIPAPPLTSTMYRRFLP